MEDVETDEPAALGDGHSARPYQLELLDAAFESNTIILLGTGAGKTFIAVMLIKQLCHQVVQPFGEIGSKRTVFLVNTVPLVTQQADYIERHTPLKVGKYFGEMGVDGWDQQTWNQQLEQYNILVMTRQIFLDMLKHRFISLSKVNLIVFDECHHAVGNDPYKLIMQFYLRCPENDRPHILGLSASIISGNCKPGDLPKKLRDLEATLHCRTETARDLAEVSKYATNPDETLYWFDPRPAGFHAGPLKSRLDGLRKFLDSSLTTKSNPKPRKTRRDLDFKNIVEECITVLEDISITSTIDAVTLAKEEVNEILQEDVTLTSWERKLAELVLTNLTILADECRETLRHGANDHSPKLIALLEILAETNPCLSRSTASTPMSSSLYFDDAKLCGIIFVQKRITAICLSKMINKLRDGFLQHIKCSYIIGHGGSKILEQGSNMNVRKQQDVLRRFRTDSLNLLVATSVVEEGLDVRKCNLVVRYDFPLTFQSYVQSKGRARAKKSRYLLLVDKECLNEFKSKLTLYCNLEKDLQLICHDRVVPGEDEIERKLKHLLPPYMPFGEDGPQISINGSLSLLHRYCQKLPSDRYTVFAPEFHTLVVDGGVCFLDGEQYEDLFLVKITLPINCPIKEEMQGPALPSAQLAKKAAALEVLEKLHKEGELDDHLKPIPHKDIDSDEEDEEKMREKKKNKAGTTRRIMYYRNEIPSCLTQSQPKHGSGNHLYVFLMKDKHTGKLYQSMDNQYSHKTLGILTSKPIPYHKIPKFSLYIEKREISVTVIKQQSMGPLSASELQTFQDFHVTLFTKIIKIQGLNISFDGSGPSRGYLVVPVCVIPQFDPPECYLDQDMAKYVIAAGQERVIPSWPCESHEFINRLVSKHYREEIVHEQNQLYEVISINPEDSPLSICHFDKSINYSQYFFRKYNYKMKYNVQPSITCKPVSMGTNSLQLTVSRFKLQEKTTRNNHIILFPELCQIYPLPANVWNLCRCVPSLISRLEALLLMDEFSNIISCETGIGVSRQNGCEVTTTTEVSKHQHHATEYSLSSICVYTNQSGDKIIDPVLFDLAVPQGTGNILRKPNSGLLLQSLTSVSVNDCIDLERLEALGDSFLKLVTTVDLYCSRSNHHEGKLALARTRRISNFNLCYLANKIGLPGKIFSKTFEPLSNWIPPRFTPPDSAGDPVVAPPELPQEKLKYLYHKVADKGVADCVEAMIGAYIIAGGIEAGWKFLQFLGLKLGNPQMEIDNGDASVVMRTPSQESCMSVDIDPSSCLSVPILVQNSLHIFQEYCQPPPSALLRQGEHCDALIIKMTSTCTSLCEKLDWDFQDRALLLQALTHPSYIKNRVTDCYQRLEFLGDAILDYLITSHIYGRFPEYSPGKITDMRSALVNNITFAEIAVKKLDLNQHLKQLSPALFSHISEFVEVLKRISQKETHEEKHEIYCKSESDEVDLNPLESLSSISFDDEDDDVEDLDPPKALGDVLESIAGALFLDCGMSLETVWLKFYPFFKPLIETFSKKGLPIQPVKELYEMVPQSVQIEKSLIGTDHGKHKHRCTVKVVDKGIQVSAVAGTFRLAKNAAARRAIRKLRKM